MVSGRGVERARGLYQPDKSDRVQLHDGDCGGGSSVPVNQTRTAQGACEALVAVETRVVRTLEVSERAPRASNEAGEWRPADDAARMGERGGESLGIVVK